MTSPSPDPSGPVPGSNPLGEVSGSRRVRLLILVLLAPAIVLPLLVGLFDRVDPTLADFPFYFWFQMLLILFSCAVTGVAFFLARHADRLDRQARRGGAAGR